MALWSSAQHAQPISESFPLTLRFMGGGLSVAEQQLVDGDSSALSRLSGRRSLPPDNAFWMRLHEIRFTLDHLDHHQVARVVDIICGRMVQNNIESRNLNVLLAIVCEKVGETVAGSPVLPVTTNLIFLARTFIKYFCENLTARQLQEQLDDVFLEDTRALSIAIIPDHDSSHSHLPLPERLLCVLVDACINVRLEDATMDFHIEIMYSLLVLFSTQMYAGCTGPNLFIDILFEKLPHKITPLCEVMLSRFVLRSPLTAFSPTARSNAAAHSWFNVLGHSVISVFLWPFQIYRLLFSKKDADHLVSDAAAFILLILTHQPDGKDEFREALRTIQDVDDVSVAKESPTISFDQLFESLAQGLFNKQHQNWAVLLLFTMIRTNPAFCEFVYSKSDVDVLVMPLLEMAYKEEKFDSNLMYMILVILLILTNDDSFCDNAHRRLSISHVPWFSELRLQEITLGSLIMAVLLRIMQRNQATLRDTYLHSNCLAALCNLAPHTTFIHEHTAKRLVSLLAALSRRYTRIADKINNPPSQLERSDVRRRGSFCDDDASVEGMATFGEFIRLLLETICACLCSGNLADNMPLLYCLMHDQRVLEPFHHDAELGAVAQLLWILVHDFIDRLSLRSLPDDCSVGTVQNVLRHEARIYQFSPSLEIPSIQKFSYEDSGESRSFFLSYSWEVVFSSSTIPWARDRIELFLVPISVAEESTPPHPPAEVPAHPAANENATVREPSADPEPVPNHQNVQGDDLV